MAAPMCTNAVNKGALLMNKLGFSAFSKADTKELSLFFCFFSEVFHDIIDAKQCLFIH